MTVERGESPAGQAGPAERKFVEWAVAKAPWARGVIVVVGAVLGVVALPRTQVAAASAVAAAVVAWSVLYPGLARRIRARGGADSRARAARALLAADLTVLTGVCLSQPLTIGPEPVTHGNTWVCAVVTVVVVTYQCTHPPRTAAAVAGYLVAADMLGVRLTGTPDWTSDLWQGGWILVEAALARGGYALVRTQARRADLAYEEAAASRRHTEAERVRRAAERRFLAALHDTACATLVMASLPAVTDRASSAGASPTAELRAQAGRDLERLARTDTLEGDLELAPLLAQEADRHPLRVAVVPEDTARGVRLPTPVALAFRDGIGEALRNVARHAGVGRAELRLRVTRGDTVVAELADTGAGFDPGAVPPQRRGIQLSLRERMAGAGGRARVDSSPGRGTTVRLEWPDG